MTIVEHKKRELETHTISRFVAEAIAASADIKNIVSNTEIEIEVHIQPLNINLEFIKSYVGEKRNVESEVIDDIKYSFEDNEIDMTSSDVIIIHWGCDPTVTTDRMFKAFSHYCMESGFIAKTENHKFSECPFDKKNSECYEAFYALCWKLGYCENIDAQCLAFNNINQASIQIIIKDLKLSLTNLRNDFLQDPKAKCPKLYSDLCIHRDDGYDM